MYSSTTLMLPSGLLNAPKKSTRWLQHLLDGAVRTGGPKRRCRKAQGRHKLLLLCWCCLMSNHKLYAGMFASVYHLSACLPVSVLSVSNCLVCVYLSVSLPVSSYFYLCLCPYVCLSAYVSLSLSLSTHVLFYIRMLASVPLTINTPSLPRFRTCLLLPYLHHTRTNTQGE